MHCLENTLVCLPYYTEWITGANLITDKDNKITFLSFNVSGKIILIVNKEKTCVTVNAIHGCGFDPHSKKWNIYLNVYFHVFALGPSQSAALSCATQHAMLSEFGGKWGTEGLNTNLGTLCLPCCVRDTAWSWFNLILNKTIFHL